MNLSEFEVKHRNFVGDLINKMPEINNTLNTLFEIKRQRKLKKLAMQKEPIKEPITPTELNTSEGEESIEEMNDWETHTADERFD